MFGFSNSVIDLSPISPGLENSFVFHQSEMLGGVLHRGSNLFGNLADCEFAITQGPDDLDPVGISQDATEFGLFLSLRDFDGIHKSLNHLIEYLITSSSICLGGIRDKYN
jgi:hypothetical protein